MKILLTAVNAKYIHSNLAVYSLRASAGPYRPLVELKEYTINQQPDEVLGIFTAAIRILSVFPVISGTFPIFGICVQN